MVYTLVLEASAARIESSSLSLGTKFARFVYRLGHGPFKAVRRVRFPYRVPFFEVEEAGRLTSRMLFHLGETSVPRLLGRSYERVE